MPSFPRVASSASGLAAGIYSAIAERLDNYQGEVFPLHVGDTWLEPAPGCHMQDLHTAEIPGLHRYSSPHGLPELREAVAGRVARRTGQRTTADEVLITAGATGGLAAAAGALLDPGDEVLILAPYWPLIRGIVHSFGGVPVDAPCLGAVESAEEAREVLAARYTSRTVALYLSTPNNPTGLALPASWIEAMVTWATDKGLWILADEVYEDYQYAGTHTYCRPLAPERTLAAYSFSKAYGMAGNRCGYLVGPAEILTDLKKISTHTFYSTPTASQWAALKALGPDGDRWLQNTHRAYLEVAKATAQRLSMPTPVGSTFLFLDVSAALDERGLQGFLEDCADRGLLLAPGPSFGPYPNHVRLCFTAVEPARTRRGVEVLAGLLGR